MIRFLDHRVWNCESIPKQHGTRNNLHINSYEMIHHSHPNYTQPSSTCNSQHAKCTSAELQSCHSEPAICAKTSGGAYLWLANGYCTYLNVIDTVLGRVIVPIDTDEGAQVSYEQHMEPTSVPHMVITCIWMCPRYSLNKAIVTFYTGEVRG